MSITPLILLEVNPMLLTVPT